MRFKEDDREKLKRMRRARRGRTLPRSGDGPHEETRLKKIDEIDAEELDQEIEDWKRGKYSDYDEYDENDVANDRLCDLSNDLLNSLEEDE